MREGVVARLSEVVESIEANIEVTAACGRQGATKLLQMARLDLLCEIHEISDSELLGFAEELARRHPTREGSVVYLAERRRERASGG